MGTSSAAIRSALTTTCLVLALAGETRAKPDYPQFVNDWCTSQNRIPAQPIPTAFPTSCETCHQPGTFDKVHVVLPAWQEMKNGNYAWFCPLLANANQPPILAPIGNQTVAEGSTLTISLSASDVDGGSLAFSASDLPPGASFADRHDGTASFAWTPLFDQAGTFLVTFSVSDSASPPASDAEQIAITVGNINRPPVLATVGSHSVDEGAALAFSISASDPDGDALRFAGANLPTGATLTDRGDGTADFAWVPGYDQAGNFTVTASVSDAGDPIATDSETFTITVGNVNRPPVLASVGNRAVAPGQLLEIALGAADPDGDTLQFAAAGLPDGASFQDLGNGSASFSWMPRSDQLGNHAVTFSVTDSGQPMASDSEGIVITVGTVNRPPVLGTIGSRSAEVGQLLSIPLSATDPDGDPLAFSASGVPTGAALVDHDNGSAEFSWIPGPDQVGNHMLTFQVSDAGVPTETDSEEITISVGGVNRPPVLAPIGERTLHAGELLRVPVTAEDPDGDALSFEAFDLPPGARFSDNRDGTALLEWTPGTDQAGQYTIGVVVRDSGSPPAEDSENVVIRVDAAVVEPPVPPMVYDLALRAAWRRWLYVRGGTTEPGASVSIFDGVSGALIGEVTAGRDGSFRARLRPAHVPCSVRASSGSHASPVVEVHHAPAACDATQPVGRVRDQEGSAEDRELEVEGARRAR